MSLFTNIIEQLKYHCTYYFLTKVTSKLQDFEKKNHKFLYMYNVLLRTFLIYVYVPNLKD